jgi:hypothetical protein
MAIALLLYLLPWYVIFTRLSGTPFGIDFQMLSAASNSALQLRNPYTSGPGFYNPPWMLLIVAPFAILPHQLGFWTWTVTGVAAYAAAFRRMGLNWPETLMLIFSPLAIGNLMFGNYDWLILLAATLPPAWGMWFMVLKPQLGGGLAALWSLWGIQAGMRKFAVTVLPVAVAILLSYLLGYRLPASTSMTWSADAWPWGIPVGVGLMYLAIRKEDPLLALAASPFLSPYVVWHSWIAVLLPLARKRWALGAGILASWIFFWYVFAR